MSSLSIAHLVTIVTSQRMAMKMRGPTMDPYPTPSWGWTVEDVSEPTMHMVDQPVR